MWFDDTQKTLQSTSKQDIRGLGSYTISSTNSLWQLSWYLFYYLFYVRVHFEDYIYGEINILLFCFFKFSVLISCFWYCNYYLFFSSHMGATT